MNYFPRLPLKLRLVVVLSFLVASVIVGIAGKPSRVLLLTAALLLLSGGWRISKARSFVFVLILMPALFGLVLTHFDWQHPFLSRYAAGLFSVIAVLLLMDGIRIEEWIELLHAKGDGTPVSRLAPCWSEQPLARSRCRPTFRSRGRAANLPMCTHGVPNRRPLSSWTASHCRFTTPLNLTTSLTMLFIVGALMMPDRLCTRLLKAAYPRFDVRKFELHRTAVRSE